MLKEAKSFAHLCFDIHTLVSSYSFHMALNSKKKYQEEEKSNTQKQNSQHFIFLRFKLDVEMNFQFVVRSGE